MGGKSEHSLKSSTGPHCDLDHLDHLEPTYVYKIDQLKTTISTSVASLVEVKGLGTWYPWM